MTAAELALEQKGELRFTRLSEIVAGISQKMLTQLGLSLAFCGVWVWTEKHLDQVNQARHVFDGKARAP